MILDDFIIVLIRGIKMIVQMNRLYLIFVYRRLKMCCHVLESYRACCLTVMLNLREAIPSILIRRLALVAFSWWDCQKTTMFRWMFVLMDRVRESVFVVLLGSQCQSFFKFGPHNVLGSCLDRHKLHRYTQRFEQSSCNFGSILT